MQVQNRPKIKFIPIHFLNLSFQKLSTDQQGTRVHTPLVHRYSRCLKPKKCEIHVSKYEVMFLFTAVPMPPQDFFL